MTIDAARAFHERVSTDVAFRTRLESASESEANALILEAGFRFSPSDWGHFQKELSLEQRAVVDAREEMSRDRWEEAYRIVRKARSDCPRSWVLLEMEAALTGRLGGAEDAIGLLLDLSPESPCLATLAPPERERTLAVLAFTLGYLAFHPAGDDASESGVFEPHPKHASSGWQTEPAPEEWFVRRPLDVGADLDLGSFLEEYGYRNCPVILAGLTEDWPAWSTWRRDALLGKYGRESIEIHSSRQANDFRKGQKNAARRQVTLEEFVSHYMRIEHEHWYLFKIFENRLFSGDFVDSDLFGEHFRRPYRDDDPTLFYVGGRGTGLNYHQHPAAWNGLVFGYKLWSLLPPLGVHRFKNGPLDPDDVSTAIDPLRIVFVQCPGEVVFVPQFWSHATYNLTDCVGIAREIGIIEDSFGRLRSAIRQKA